MKTESIADWKKRTKKSVKILPAREAKGLKKNHNTTSPHMGTKNPTHAWWKDEDKK